MWYLLILLFAFVFAYRYKLSQWNNYYKLLYVILCIANILIFGLRYKVGGDTIVYMGMYERATSLNKLTLFSFIDNAAAPLFIIVMSVFKTFTNDFIYWQFFHSLFLNICVFVFLHKHALNPFLAFIFFFYIVGLYFNTETLKESSAIAIFLLNYDNVIRKKWIRYYVVTILSIGCHYGALILLFIPFFSQLKISWKLFVYVLLYMFLVSYVVDYIFANFPYVMLAERASNYADATEHLSANYTFMLIIKYVLIPCCLLLINKQYRINQNRVLEPMVCLYLFMGLGGIYYKGVFERWSNYFALFFFAYLANVLTTINKKEKVVAIMIWFLVITPYAYEYSGPIMKRWLPYYSVLDKDSYRERMIDD